MNKIFHGPMAGELRGFLQFKRSLGYGYMRAEFALREFDQFLSGYARKDSRWQLDRAAIAWLSSKPQRKPVSVSMDAAILRQLFTYLRRLPHLRVVEPRWPRLPTESTFVPHYLAERDVVKLLALCADLKRPVFRARLYRALVLILYCTGVRFGEALRLRMRDVDTHRGVLFVETFKGRARWVPFHRTLSRELDRYLAERVKYAPSGPDTRFFVGANQRVLPVSTAHGTIHGLFAKAGLKPEKGRVGPRPYDLRHAFAVQRLTRWYRQGADLHARLPWLSAYMGHVDIVGTEAYLNATPELLELAAHRLHWRYRKASGEEEQSV
ncbi:MAG: tyrosine-type recombinase/integrase [Candidatus Solibacter sp.]